MKKLLSGILATAIILTTIPVSAMASDIDNNWAKQYITYLHEKNIMLPTGTNFKPNNKISRAEFMRYLNRAFGFSETTSINFTDVKVGEWYYNDVAKAVKHGYINGTGNGKMNPLGTLTREEAATIIGRLHKMTLTDSDSIAFSDKASIGSWSAPYINEAVKKKYIVGYPDNTFRPKGEITRSEISKILYYFMGTRLDTASVFGTADVQTDRDNVTMTAGGSQLFDTQINGNLYITEGVLGEQVSLKGVTVKGAIIVGGGYINLTDVTANALIVSSPVGRQLTVNAIGKTNVGQVTVRSDAALSETELDVSAGGFSDVTLNGTSTASLTLDADVWSLNVQTPATVQLSGDAVVNSLNLSAAATVNGTGKVYKAVIKANGVNMAMEPEKYEIDKGITATINGASVTGSNSMSVSPSSATFDKNSATMTGNYTDIDVTVSAGTDAVTLVKCDGNNLKEDNEYRITKGVFKFYKSFMSDLKEGSHTIEFILKDNVKTIFLLNVIDTSKNTLNKEQVDFDRYTRSPNYQDIVINVNASYGNSVKQLIVSGTALKEGEDYIYKNGVATIYKAFVAKRAKGVMNITFDMTNGNDPQLSVNIADSSPVNLVKPEKIKFDTNASSDSYDDVKVTLRLVDGAKLEDIKYQNKIMVPTQDYYLVDENVSKEVDTNIVENVVVLRKKGLQSIKADKNYTDLTFVMSKGENPQLRVEFVNTFVTKFVVTDDAGRAIKGAAVTIGETKATTDSDGIAKFNLENGDYTAKIDTGTKTLEKTFTVSGSSREIAVTIDVLYNVKITVTSSTGAKISGASVTLGTSTVTTGADGEASFQIKRGPYQLKVSCTGYTSQTTTISVTDEVIQRIILATY